MYGKIIGTVITGKSTNNFIGLAKTCLELLESVITV